LNNVARPYLPLRLPRQLANVVALALAASVSVLALDVHAQDIGLRGTSDAESLAASPLVKKRKLKAVAQVDVTEAAGATASNGTAGETNDGSSRNEDAAATGQPTSPDEAETVTEDPFAGEDITASTGTPVTRSNIPVDDEIPAAINRVDSDGAQERDLVGPLGRENERTDAIEGKDSVSESDPFAAPGIRSGAFVIRPTLESGIRYGSNPDDPTCNCNTTQSETKVTVRAESDWIRHGLNLEMRGTAEKPFSSSSAYESEFNGGFRIGADGRLDISVRDTATFAASVESGREVLSSGGSTGYARRSMQTALRAAAGYSHDAGPIGLSINGQAVHTSYGDAINLAGVSVAQDDRDNLNASLTLRGTYELSGAISPFAEVEVGRRLYDNKFDAAGIEQSATRYSLRAGAEFNQGEKLSGELAAGWFVENPDDATLPDVSGLDLRGTFNWSPVRDTTVTVIASTAMDGASSTSAESSVNYNVSADFKRKLRANIDGNILLTASVRDYTGTLDTQTTLGAEAGLTWWFNRFAGVNGKASYSQTSGIAGGSRDSVGAYMGLVLRR
jgi:hypothetical protein